MLIDNMQAIDKSIAEQNGVDFSMVNICKKLRGLAKLDRLRLDETEHRSGLNKHLFNYIEYCGFDVLSYIKSYLSNLQPYMIERRKDQESKDSYVCVIDRIYRVSVYIKVDIKQFEELVISFHENNVRGIAKSNAVITRMSDNVVPVFAEDVDSVNLETGVGSVRLMVQRGMKVLPISVQAVRCDSVFLVRERIIENELLNYCNNYLMDLYASDVNLDYNSITVFSMLQQISFTSYGKDTFSAVSLLIDSIATQGTKIGRDTADFALTMYVQSLNLTNEQATDLYELLVGRWSVTSIRDITLILERVKIALGLSYEKQYDVNDYFKAIDNINN